MSEFDLSAVRAWLDLLHQGSDGLIHICSAPNNWTGRTFSEPSDAADYVARLDASGAQGIYLRTTTLARVPRNEQGQIVRGGAADSLALPGFAADIDIAGPGHKHDPAKHEGRDLPPDAASAALIVAESGLPTPTVWVHSGGGLYPWWLLEETLLVDDPDVLSGAEILSNRIQLILKATAKRLGLHYGGEVGDLARVLRIPGTVNRKAGGAVTARVLEPASYEFYDFNDLMSLVGELHNALPVEKPVTPIQAKALTAGSDLTPGDDFEARTPWSQILLPQGATYMYSRGQTDYWRRPGKDSGGHSGTTGRASDRDRLYVFSGDWAPFEPNKAYNKFAAYALIHHNGDHSAAASDLRKLGFGGTREPSVPRVNLSSLIGPRDELIVTPETPGMPAPAEPMPTNLGPVLDGEDLPVFTDTVFATRKWRETGLINMYVDVFSPTFKYVSMSDEWMAWDGLRWDRDDRGLHRHAARRLVERMETYADMINISDPDVGKKLLDSARRMATMQKINALPNAAKSDPSIAATTYDFDATDHLVTVDNGVLNLKTLELQPFDPKLMLTKKMNAPFTPGVRGERLDKFLAEVMPDIEVRKYAQRLLGACATGKADERVIVMLNGESGSGKSAFLEMVYAVLGDFAAIAEESTFKPLPDNYQGPSEKLHKLRGARFVKMSELAQGSTLNESVVKSVTGSDTQSTRPLYGHPVEWKVQYMVWLATNHLPRISCNDEAIWNRIKPINFPGRFIDDQGRVSNPDDRDLGRKIAKEEAAAVLNWILEGLEEYNRIGLAEPAIIAEWLGEYRDDVDTTRQFVREAVDAGQVRTGESESVGVRELYKIYTAWCADNRITPVGSSNFSLRMLANKWVKDRRAKGMVWLGIGISGFIAESQSPVWGARTSPTSLSGSSTQPDWHR